MPSDAIAPGTLLAGRYRVERTLGEGSMGVVLAARHVDLDELRAIKLMLPSSLGEGEHVERFIREARAAVRLKSPHVARVLDVGRLDDGGPFIVMEYLEGSDLKRVCDARGALPPEEIALYIHQACEAIGEAHAAGIVHRDLKPANLFLTTGPNGAPCIKVLDFGIAKLPGAPGAPDALEMTGPSDILGTPVFMSPEQMRSTRDVDARTDVWALGVVLYRALTGRFPFAGSTITQVCAAVVADVPELPSSRRADLPPGLDAVVMRCLEKNPAQRFANATELAAALAPFAGLAPPVAVPRAPLAAPAGALKTLPLPMAPPAAMLSTNAPTAPIDLSEPITTDATTSPMVVPEAALETNAPTVPIDLREHIVVPSAALETNAPTMPLDLRDPITTDATTTPMAVPQTALETNALTVPIDLREPMAAPQPAPAPNATTLPMVAPQAAFAPVAMTIPMAAPKVAATPSAPAPSAAASSGPTSRAVRVAIAIGVLVGGIATVVLVRALGTSPPADTAPAEVAAPSITTATAAPTVVALAPTTEAAPPAEAPSAEPAAKPPAEAPSAEPAAKPPAEAARASGAPPPVRARPRRKDAYGSDRK